MIPTFSLVPPTRKCMHCNRDVPLATVMLGIERDETIIELASTHPNCLAEWHLEYDDGTVYHVHYDEGER